MYLSGSCGGGGASRPGRRSAKQRGTGTDRPVGHPCHAHLVGLLREPLDDPARQHVLQLGDQRAVLSLGIALPLPPAPPESEWWWPKPRSATGRVRTCSISRDRLSGMSSESHTPARRRQAWYDHRGRLCEDSEITTWQEIMRAVPLTKRSQSGTSALERAWMRTLRAYRFTPGSERCMDSFSAFRVGRYSSVRRWIGACTARASRRRTPRS